MAMEKRTFQRRRGFSLQELLIVIVILGICAGIGFAVGGKQIAKGRLSSISSDISIMSNEVETAIVELGFLESTADTDAVLSYFRKWDSGYLTYPLQVDNLTIVRAGEDFGMEYSGVLIKTGGYTDPWENEVRLYYMVSEETGSCRIVIASAGPNGKWAEDAGNGYLSNNRDDDVVMVMDSKV